MPDPALTATVCVNAVEHPGLELGFVPGLLIAFLLAAAVAWAVKPRTD